MNYISEWLENAIGMSGEIQSKILLSILIILIISTIYRLISRFISKNIEDTQSFYKMKKTSNYITVMLGIIIIALVWSEQLKSIITILGIFSAGLAIALKDPVVNVAGWVFIIWRKPFEVGDRIQTGGHTGDVIDLRVFSYTLLEIGNWVEGEQSTGRIIHVPNGKIFNETLANYSKGFQYIWNEIPVLITFESNWQKAKEILQDIANRHAEHASKKAEKQVKKAAKKYMIFYANLTPTVYTSVKDSGISLNIRYLCEPRHRRGTAHVIWEDILMEFAQRADIDFAYPTQRLYNNLKEGKVSSSNIIQEDIL